MTDFSTLDIKLHDTVAVMTLSREARNNAVNSVMNRELPQAWDLIEKTPEIRAVVVTGAGKRAFCSGADLADLPVTDDLELANSIHSISWSSKQNNVRKPVIIAVNGMTIGGGLHFPAEGDIVIASETATFFDTHVAVGLVAALEPIVLARRMPLGAVMKLALTGGGERMTAAEAMRCGLVDEVVSQDALLDRAIELAQIIAAHSPTAVARTKASIWHAKEAPLHEALDYGWRQIMAQSAHPDMQEGIAAFAEKRAPAWRPLSAPDAHGDAP